MTDVLEALNAVTNKVLRYQPRLQERKELTAPSTVRKPRFLDLFCCAGDAGIGYSQAGFEVVGFGGLASNRDSPGSLLSA
jgi:hypothetical protein